MATILSWEDAQRQHEMMLALNCARSIDRFAAWVEDLARTEDLDCACKTVLPVLPGRRLIGPVEARILHNYSVLQGDETTLLHFIPAISNEEVKRSPE